MLEYNEIVRAGFSKKEKRPLGFAVNTREAFKEVRIGMALVNLSVVPPCFDLFHGPCSAVLHTDGVFEVLRGGNPG